jgi:hypothetical protein
MEKGYIASSHVNTLQTDLKLFVPLELEFWSNPSLRDFLPTMY